MRRYASHLLLAVVATLSASCRGDAGAAGGLAGEVSSGPAPSSWPGSPPGASHVRVVRVSDGDTVVLDGIDVGRFAARGRSARLIGIDTPEANTCFGDAATRFTRRELDGRGVMVDFDVGRTDRYGRALVYVWTDDGTLFNARLAAEGYAMQLTVPPNVRYAELFGRLATQARAAGRGLWGPTCKTR